MPEFSYKAASANGSVVKGTRFADSEADLVAILKQEGLLLLSLRKASGVWKLLTEVQIGGVPRRELIEFCYHLGVMIRAGVPIVRALDELCDDLDNPYLAKMIKEVSKDIQAGDTLHEAMAKRPKVFPRLMSSVVAIGESSGRLDKVFFGLARHMKRIETLASTTRKAMIYPSFVLLAMCLAAFVFLVLVFPPLLAMLAEFKVDLPMITTVVMVSSDLLSNHWPALLSGLTGFLIIFLLARRHGPSRYHLDWLELHTPGFRKLFIQLRLTFFMRYMAMLLSSGVDILRGLDLGIQAVGNLVLRETLEECRRKIAEGSHFSAALQESAVIPRMVIRMMSVGEESGTLDEQMERIADYYDEELTRRIDLALTLMEPVMILMLALLAMALVMGVMLPLYSLVTQMSGQVGSGM